MDEILTSLPADVAQLKPAQARAHFRAGLRTPTAGWCAGYTQANVIIVPEDYAFEVLLFCQRNPKPCPLLGVLEPGQTAGPLLADGDIRTDIPAYTIYRDGELAGTVGDLNEVWQDDLVTFILGCSFTFETPLQRAGIRVAHIDQGCNVPMYQTTRRCAPAGRISGPLVVSMRPLPADQISDAVRISARYPAVHGAPVHIGNPAALGIEDLSQPDFGDPVEIPADHIPVFWACGVTPQAAVMQSRPPLAFGHAPGHMLITDAHDSDYQIP
ncbi:MAG: putative hydro-lyase [Bowdeniella nasicola]|nr:putative hydro-lyase [Bowdeniella nasicola]